VPFVAGKNLKTTATDAINAVTPGATTTATTDGKTNAIKDAGSTKTYDFNTLQMQQTISVPGVSFTGTQTAIFYKQFGNQAAAIAYTCKDETWQSKYGELGTIASSFMVKTER
jgi:hypothetical protein